MRNKSGLYHLLSSVNAGLLELQEQKSSLQLLFILLPPAVPQSPCICSCLRAIVLYQMGLETLGTIRQPEIILLREIYSPKWVKQRVGRETGAQPGLVVLSKSVAEPEALP